MAGCVGTLHKTIVKYLYGTVGDHVEDAAVQHNGGQQAPPLVLVDYHATLLGPEPNHAIPVGMYIFNVK